MPACRERRCAELCLPLGDLDRGAERLLSVEELDRAGSCCRLNGRSQRRLCPEHGRGSRSDSDLGCGLRRRCYRNLHWQSEGHRIEALASVVETAERLCPTLGQRGRDRGKGHRSVRDGWLGERERSQRHIVEGVLRPDLCHALELTSDNIHTKFTGLCPGDHNTKVRELDVQRVDLVAIDGHRMRLEMHTVAFAVPDVRSRAVLLGASSTSRPVIDALLDGLSRGAQKGRLTFKRREVVDVVSERGSDSPFKRRVCDGSFCGVRGSGECNHPAKRNEDRGGPAEEGRPQTSPLGPPRWALL